MIRIQVALIASLVFLPFVLRLIFLDASEAPANAWAAPTPTGPTSAVSAASLSCLSTNPDDLTVLRRSVAPSGLVTGDQILAGGGEDELVFLPRGKIDPSAKDIRIRIIVQPGAGTKSASVSKRVDEQPLSAAPLPADRAKDLGIPDFDKALLLRAAIPDNDPWSLANPFSFPLWVNTTFAVYVCDGATLTAWATHSVDVSGSSEARVTALALVFLVYAFAAMMLYFDRYRAANASVGEPISPRRLKEIKPWRIRECFNPILLTSDIFDRGSLSKFQILVFAGCVSFELTELTLRTGVLSDLSPTVIYLLGIPAAGSLSVQLTATRKDRLSASNWAWLVARGVLPLNDPGTDTPRWADLIVSNSELDLSKLQALVFTVIVATAMIMSGGSAVATFSVPSNLLQILGLSQLVFVGGRFIEPMTLGDADNLVTQMRQRLDDLRAAATTGLDVDADGKPGRGPPKPSAPFTTFAQVQASLPIAARRYLDVVDQVEILLDTVAHRSIEMTNLKTPMI